MDQDDGARECLLTAHQRGVLAGTLALAGAAALARPALAQAPATWPTRPVRMVVAYPAGGGTDIVARLFSEKLAQR